MKKYFKSTPPPHAWSDSRYRSFSQLFPANTYVPQRLTLNSRSAYHSGQGGGAATCFISFPEYVSVPAKATGAIAAMANRPNMNFFIYFSFWLSLPFTPTSWSVQVNNETRYASGCREFGWVVQNCKIFFHLII